MPSSTTDRTLRLAAEVSAGAASRFDQAAALEAYLRSIPYSATIDPPPAGQDLVDWFLFDEQRGYCDYYASAFVVMARSLGIPARLAAGYAAGNYLPETGAYRQLESNAHSWPEVYFPGGGWVAFEPTANQPALQRAVPAAGGASPGTDFAEPQDERGKFLPGDGEAPAGGGQPTSAASVGLTRLGRIAIALLGALLVLAAGAAVGSWALWWRPLRGLSVAEAAFARLTRVAAWLGLGPSAADTPHEYSRRLGEAVPEGQSDIRAITDAFVRERFGRRRGTAATLQLAATWRRLRRRFARAAPRLTLGRALNRSPRGD